MVAIAATSLNTVWRSGPGLDELVAVTPMDAVCGGVSTRSRTIIVPVQKLPPEPTNITSGWLSARPNFRAPAYHCGSRNHNENGTSERSKEKTHAYRLLCLNQSRCETQFENSSARRIYR